MSKPKNMTPEQEAAWIESEIARKKAWNKANVEKNRILNKAWREANPEKARACEMAYLEKSREKRNAIKRKNAENITPLHVAKALRMKVSEVPPDLLELKREQIAMYRLVSKLNQAIDETNQENHHE
jgi:hypothetical protein